MKLYTTHYIAIAFSLVLSISSKVFSQAIGLGAGMNISNLHFYDTYNDNDYYDDYNSIISINAGAYYDLSFNENMGMRFGLGYSAKGLSYKNEVSDEYTIGNEVYSSYAKDESKVRFDYIQFNPMFKYTMGVGEGIDTKTGSQTNAFYALIGPYISFGISGKVDSETIFSYTDVNLSTVTTSSSDSRKLEFGDDGDGFDYIDFGFTPVIGFQFNKIFFEASYDFGLNNIESYNDDDFKIYNRTISIKMGYIFGK